MLFGNVLLGDDTTQMQTDSDRFGATVHGVPREMYYYFNRNPNGTDEGSVRKMRDILDTYNDGSLSGTLLKMKDVETKLGYPTCEETREEKIWNYIQMSKVVGDQDKANKIMFNKGA